MLYIYEVSDAMAFDDVYTRYVFHMSDLGKPGTRIRYQNQLHDILNDPVRSCQFERDLEEAISIASQLNHHEKLAEIRNLVKQLYFSEESRLDNDGTITE
jgi:hypothetical protein